MASKKKILTSAVAVATAAALLLGGTFAWQSISQTALNEKEASINPGGRLHDDFNGVNKDVYVENFADNDIFARVRLDEYFEIIANKGIEGAETTDVITVGATKDDTDTYLTHKFDAANTTDNYWNWITGGSKTYMPTFNKNKDSLKADINGTLGYTDEEGNADPYGDYVEYTDGQTVIANAVYDADSNNVEETDGSGVAEVEETHTAAVTGNGRLISMAEWLALSDEYSEEMQGNYWVYDADGWCYWSSPIKAGNATGLLLNEIELKSVMEDSYYYAINVVGQFITADDLGKDDNTGFYADAARQPSANALTLLGKIGVEVSTDTVDAGEEPALGEETVAAIKAVETPGESTDTVTIDGIEWYVLARDDAENKAMLFAKTPLLDDDSSDYKAMVFNTEKFDGGSPKYWESSIRTYLNNTWLPTMPTLSRAAVETTIYTRENASYGDYKSSQDKAFLLSHADLTGKVGSFSPGCLYDASDMDYTYNNAQLTSNTEILGFDKIGSIEKYWLRNEGEGGSVVYVLSSGSWGGTTEYSNANNMPVGVRPAMWVTLGAVDSE